MNEGPSNVEIRAAIEEKSISLQAKSRAVSAIDRLVGGLINIPAEWLQGQANIIRERLAANAKAANSNEVLDIIESQEKLRLLRAAENKGKTVKFAIENLKEKSDQTVDGQIDDSWLDTFDQYSSQASSDDARQLWALVLSRKIEDPEGVSTSTLNLLASLNAETAKDFEELRVYAFDSMIFVEQGAGGVSIKKLSDLQASGLISGMGSLLTQEFTATDEGYCTLILGDLVLQMKPSNQRNISDVSVILFTPAGQEIHKLLPTIDEEALAINIVKLCENKISEAVLGRIHSRDGNRITWSILKYLLSNNAE